MISASKITLRQISSSGIQDSKLNSKYISLSGIHDSGTSKLMHIDRIDVSTPILDPVIEMNDTDEGIQETPPNTGTIPTRHKSVSNIMLGVTKTYEKESTHNNSISIPI